VATAPLVSSEAALFLRVLSAIVAMARNSPRLQTEVGLALSRKGIRLSPQEVAEILGRLSDSRLIENLIRVEDGGIVVTVTVAGLRANSSRRADRIARESPNEILQKSTSRSPRTGRPNGLGAGRASLRTGSEDGD
jgi:hypothetical protein